MSDTVIEFSGLTVVQVSQNQAAVVSDPQNHVFVIKNSGFVAYAIEGTYNVLSIVDQTHLPTKIQDRITGVVLGWYAPSATFYWNFRPVLTMSGGESRFAGVTR